MDRAPRAPRRWSIRSGRTAVSAPDTRSGHTPVSRAALAADPDAIELPGDCVEKATREEKEKPEAACKPILDCLNNPQCVKTYCQATTIRQGWALKSAE